MTEKEKHEDKNEKAIVYELGYHLVPSLGEDDLALRVTDLQKTITAKGGSIKSEGEPQAFKLAYPMRKMQGGRWSHYDSTFFGWVRFELLPTAMAELKDDLEHNEYIVRYLIIKLKKNALSESPVKIKKEIKEVEVEPKELVKKQDEEEKGEVLEEELDKQIEQLIN